MEANNRGLKGNGVRIYFLRVVLHVRKSVGSLVQPEGNIASIYTRYFQTKTLLSISMPA